MGLEWLDEIEWRDLLKKDLGLVAEACGTDVARSLLENVPGTYIYVSEKVLPAARTRWIRKRAAELHARGEQIDVKRTALLLDASQRFVELALATTDEKDERQGKLL